MKKWMRTSWLMALGISGCTPAGMAQSQTQQLASVAQLLKKEGEVFVAVDQRNEQLDRICTLEDYFNNQLTTRGDSATVRFLNHTESPCERTFLRTEADYRFRPADIDPARLMLVQKKYNLGRGKLSDGQDHWYEIHLFTRNNQPLINRRDVADGSVEGANTMRILFKSQEGAKQALATLRGVIGGTAAR